MAFNFGTTQNKPLFGGQTASTAGTTGFNFGTAGPSTGFGATPVTSATGFSSFGTSTNTAGSTGFGFGAPTTTASTGFSGSTGFGFGAPTTTASTGFSGFGGGFGTGLGTTTTTSASTLGGFGGGFTGFGTNTTSASTGFGGATGFGFNTTGLGTTTTASTGFGGIGLSGTSTVAGIGAQNVQQAQQNELNTMATAVCMPVVFGDERDAIILKWNQLQAYWGSGKGFLNSQGQAVIFTPENPFCRFKAVGYSVMPSSNDQDGLVAVIFKMSTKDVQNNQKQIVDKIQQILGNKPNIAVCVECVKELPDNKSEMQLFIQERLPTGTARKIPASEVFTFMSQQNVTSQLQSQLSVENLVPKTGMSKEALKNYLNNPPAGIDQLIWQQAKMDNPDPEKFIPVPMIGFLELHNRLKHQDTQTKLHQARLDIITSDIATLQRNHANILAKTEEFKRRHLELGHRVLQVLVKQEISRKMGYAIQADEEQLRVQLEALQAELNAPTQFKGRLNELMSQIRMQNQLGVGRMEASYQMDETVQQEIRQHLKQQQDGLKHLINIVKDDLEDLKLIEQGLGDLPRH